VENETDRRLVEGEKMIVRCVSVLPNEEQAKLLGDNYRPSQMTYGLELGKEYVVFGLSLFGGMSWVDIASEATSADPGYLHPAPLCLFEIVNGHVSRYWEAHQHGDRDLMLQPRSFYRDYYHEDLADGVPEVVEDFARMRALLEDEARSPRAHLIEM
jgi:hypothetical protein